MGKKGVQRSQPCADLPLKAPLIQPKLDSELAHKLAPLLQELSKAHAGMSPLEVMIKVMHELLAAAEQLGSTSAGQTGDLFGNGITDPSIFAKTGAERSIG